MEKFSDLVLDDWLELHGCDARQRRVLADLDIAGMLERAIDSVTFASSRTSAEGERTPSLDELEQEIRATHGRVVSANREQVRQEIGDENLPPQVNWNDVSERMLEAAVRHLFPPPTGEDLEREVLRLIEQNPKWGVRQIADKLFVGKSTVQTTNAWKDKGRRRPIKKPQTIALTDKLERTLYVDDPTLEELIADHKKDYEPSPLDDAPRRKVCRRR